jgi:hypothetical protein
MPPSDPVECYQENAKLWIVDSQRDREKGAVRLTGYDTGSVRKNKKIWDLGIGAVHRTVSCLLRTEGGASGDWKIREAIRKMRVRSVGICV